jgi:uroporphyrinogen decarboxylase
MTSRERVLAAVTHGEPDVFPLDFGCHRSSGIAAIAYSKLRDYLGMEKKPIRVYDIVQQLAYIDEDMLDLFHVDTRELGRAFSENLEEWKEWTLPDGKPCLVPKFLDLRKKEGIWNLYAPSGQLLGIQKPGMVYFEQVYWPLKGQTEGITPRKILDALGEQLWATPCMPAFNDIHIDILVQKANEYYQNTDKAVSFIFGGSFWEPAGYIYGLENMFMNLALEPELVQLTMGTMLKNHFRLAASLYAPIANSVDIVVCGDDLGMQNGPMFSLDMYREFIKEPQRQIWKKLKEIGPAPINLHSCGSITSIMPDFIEIGLDTVNPVQISATNMDARNLKDHFSSKLAMWGGGCDTQKILPFGTPKEVAASVRNQIEILGKNDFIFQQVHNIMANVPPENIVAMFNEVNRIRGFSIYEPKGPVRS